MRQGCNVRKTSRKSRHELIACGSVSGELRPAARASLALAQMATCWARDSFPLLRTTPWASPVSSSTHSSFSALRNTLRRSALCMLCAAYPSSTPTFPNPVGRDADGSTPHARQRVRVWDCCTALRKLPRPCSHRSVDPVRWHAAFSSVAATLAHT